MCFFSKFGVFITLSMSKFKHSTIQLSIRGSSPRALKLVNNCSPALLWMLRRFCSNTIEQSNQMFSLWLIILPLYKQKQPLLVQHTCALCRDRILLFENTYKWIELHLYIVKNSNYIHDMSISAAGTQEQQRCDEMWTVFASEQLYINAPWSCNPTITPSLWEICFLWTQMGSDHYWDEIVTKKRN